MNDNKLVVVLPPLVEAEPVFDSAVVSDDPRAMSIFSESHKKKPKVDISRFPRAVKDGLPIFKPGDKIVIERYASIMDDHPYIDTRTYVVNSVDMETGKLTLWDDDMNQNATDNWKVGLTVGNVYTFAKGRGLPKKKGKKGRPRKPKGPDLPKGPPKKRGRPVGKKNRSREEISADKAVKAAKRSAKKAKR